MTTLLRSALVCVLLLVPGLSRAHDVMGTVIYVDVGHTRVHLDAEIPLDELSLALQKPSAPGVVAMPGTPAELLAYVLAHLSVRTPDGRPFVLAAGLGELVVHDQRNWLHVAIDATPPDGGSPRDFLLDTDVVDHRVVSHRVFVFLRSDPTGDAPPSGPVLYDTLHYQRHVTRVTLGEGSLLRAFVGLGRLGIAHIAEGGDHLAFLITLLWPVALCVGARGRWSKRRPLRDTGLAVLKLVSAFTVGHSLTLALGALHGPLLPSALVESLIALSVLISATHALVPLFPRREPWVALGFGLVHGLGFARALDGIGVDTSTLLASLAGFNLGVEVMQAAVVAVALPCAYALAGTRLGPALRVGGATASFALALTWLGERAFGLSAPFL